MLTVFWRDDEGAHEVRIERGSVRLGRSVEADLRIANPSVSRRHAILADTNGTWVLRDLQSQNGVRVNNLVTREHAIADGDVICLGDVPLRFVLSVKESIRLGDTAPPGSEAAGLGVEPGSIVLSAAAVASGSSSGSAAAGAQLDAGVAAALSQLADAAKGLMTTTSTESVFERVLALVLANTPVENAFLLVHDPEGNQLIPKAMCSRKGGAPDSAISTDIALRVFRQNESILTLDAANDVRFTSDSIATQGIRSVMCVPLLTRDCTLGVIFADSTKRRVALQQHHLHLLTLIASIAAVALEQTRLREQVEAERLLRSRLTRYHSPTLIDKLMQSLGGRGAMPPAERDVSVLFADVAGFSTRAEHMTPAAVALLLNALFSELVELIFAHEGTLDKFLGDGLMAVFGAPNDLPDHAHKAVRCALAMQKRVEELDLRHGSGSPVRLRIGINSGPALAGDMGSERRVEYTVLGNTVNIASRLEAFVARPGDTVIGPATQAALAGAIPTEALGGQQLKGISEPVAAFRVLG